ncbi:hypothetical protein [Borreliella japonica]
MKELVFIKSEFMDPELEHEKNMNMTGYLIDACRELLIPATSLIL